MTNRVYGTRLRRLGAVVAAGVIATSVAACSSDDKASSDASGSATEVHLGYFPNLTHGSAIVGDEKGYFKDALAKDGGTLKTQQFDSGSDTIDALLSGSLDATYIGPSPAITAYASSNGEAVRIVSGATEGGASLMVNDSIKSVKDLKGKTLATPGAGNTQDVALKYFLKQNGYHETAEGGGDVTVVNQDNSLSVQAFGQGDIDGAWLPEPYASILRINGAKQLVDEATLWPDGKFVTTQLLVRTAFIKDHPELVNDLLKGQIKANDYINGNPSDAKKLIGNWIADFTQTEIADDVLDSAWKNLTFTNDPIADSLLGSADHAIDLGLIEDVDLSGLYDLDPLNKLLADAGEPEVSGPSSQ